MSYAEIEAELDRLPPEELRRVALKSWSAYVAKEADASIPHVCDEEDPKLLAALDEAIAQADATPGQGHDGHQIRARLSEWISK